MTKIVRLSKKAAIEAMTRRIVDGFHPRQIVLFGSYAHGNARDNSDVDLLIIAPSAVPRWQRAVPVYRALAGIGVPKDIVWWTLEEIAEWRGVKSHFINTVLREGRVLYERAS
jgi:predicted nucleotidyltransferase